MILTRSPLRIPLGGGGTDFPSYYLKHGGYILGFALDKYVHVALNKTLDNKIRLKYSKTECVDSLDELENRVAAETLKYYDIEGGIEVATFSDVPEGSGLGGSSSFCVALVSALRCLLDLDQDKEIIFSDAYRIERQLAGQPGGMQDQWFASYGSVHCFELGEQDEATKSRSINVDDFIKNLRLVYTGTGRNDLGIADRQTKQSTDQDTMMLWNLQMTKILGRKIEDNIREGNFDAVGQIFHTHWLNKKERDESISNSVVDQMYEEGLNNGALGGKLLGLGGGGYLMFYTNNGWYPDKHIPIGIDREGCKVVYKS